jgi:hypothetical protein
LDCIPSSSFDGQRPRTERAYLSQIQRLQWSVRSVGGLQSGDPFKLDKERNAMMVSAQDRSLHGLVVRAKLVISEIEPASKTSVGLALPGLRMYVVKLNLL